MTHEMPFLDRIAFAYIRQDLGKRQMFFRSYNYLSFSLILVLSPFVFGEKISPFWLLLALSNLSLGGLLIYYLNCVEFKKGWDKETFESSHSGSRNVCISREEKKFARAAQKKMSHTTHIEDPNTKEVHFETQGEKR